jgi:hypothetical protein
MTQGLGAMHLRALASLPQLIVLNLDTVNWAEECLELGLGWLVARLRRLRVLNAPNDVLVRPGVVLTCKIQHIAQCGCFPTRSPVHLPAPAPWTVLMPMHSVRNTSVDLPTKRPLGSVMEWVPISCKQLCVTLMNNERSFTYLQQHAVVGLLKEDDDSCTYELREPPGRRLRRRPRRANLSHTICHDVYRKWPILEPQRWLWDD